MTQVPDNERAEIPTSSNAIHRNDSNLSSYSKMVSFLKEILKKEIVIELSKKNFFPLKIPSNMTSANFVINFLYPSCDT